MSKLVVFSDLHIHPWTAFASLSKDGINTRLLDTIFALNRVIKLAQKENAEAILFSGDLFHVPKIDAVAYDLAVCSLRSREIPIVMIPGNHDEASKMEAYHSMRALKREGLDVLDSKEGRVWCKLGGTKIVGAPFTPSNRMLAETLKELRKEKPDIVLLHTGFANAVMGADYIADQKDYLTATKLRKTIDFHLTVSGHFHQPQFFPPKQEQPTYVPGGFEYRCRPGTILIPGSPLQHNFGDMNSVRGAWVVDLKKKRMRMEPLGLPQFIKIDFTDDRVMEDPVRLLSGCKDEFVSVTVGSRLQAEQIREAMEGFARSYVIHIKKKSHTKSRMNVSLEMDRKKLLKLFAKSRGIKKEHSQEYLEAGMILLKKAEETK